MESFRPDEGVPYPAGGRRAVSHAHYLYDAAGQRVKKLVRKQGGATEVTHYIGDFEYHRWETAGGGSNTIVHIVDGRHRVAMVRVGPAMSGPMPEVQYQLGDHLGSATLLVDTSAALLSREEFTSYGETSFGGYERKQYRYLGLERDEETGLACHGLRYYASWTCRWISCDPIGAKGGSNLYRYSGCDPVNFNDRSGLDRQGVSNGSIFSSEKCYVPGHEPLPEQFDNLGKLSPEELDRIAQELEKAQDQRENQRQRDPDGYEYTVAQRRADNEKWLNRHRDPARVIAMAKFGAQVLAPEYAFLASSTYHSSKSLYYTFSGRPQAASTELTYAVENLVELGISKVVSEVAPKINSSRIGQTLTREEGLARVQNALGTQRCRAQFRTLGLERARKSSL